MPHSVAVNNREFSEQAARLRSLATHVPAFANDYQVLMAEMIALQAFYFFESAIETIAAKICCGAPYADGTIPTLLNPRYRTLDDALIAMRTLNRARAKGLLKWNQAPVITDNVIHMIDGAENFCTVCNNHAAKINEIRRVRNHVAHNSTSTRHEFGQVLQTRLGAVPRRLPRAGAFMLRETVPGTTILTEYVVSLGVVVKDIAKC